MARYKTEKELALMTPARRHYWRHRDRKLKELKEYRKLPHVKEKHRIDQAKWRNENKDREKEIMKKCRDKNKNIWNKERRWKYHNDAEFRAKRDEADQLYKTSGKRKAMRQKHLKKNAEKSKVWRLANPEKILIRFREYRAKKWNAHEREQRKKLNDSYIIKLLKEELGNCPKDIIPKDLIEIKKLQIKTYRLLKKQKQ